MRVVLCEAWSAGLYSGGDGELEQREDPAAGTDKHKQQPQQQQSEASEDKEAPRDEARHKVTTSDYKRQQFASRVVSAPRVKEAADAAGDGGDDAAGVAWIFAFWTER